jgi:hypothetical protein
LLHSTKAGFRVQQPEKMKCDSIFVLSGFLSLKASGKNIVTVSMRWV